MKYNGVIESKLRIIEEKLEAIYSWNITTFEQFNQSDLLQNAVERALQVAVEVMIDVSERILALEKVPLANISSYGCVSANRITERVFEVTDLVEKPKPKEAPSDMAIIGRYILTPGIFPILEKQEPGKGGEIQLTDALVKLAKEEAIYGCLFEGVRHDCGDKLGFLKATVELALQRHDLGAAFRPNLDLDQSQVTGH